MQQSNALRRLEMVLDKAITNGDRDAASGLILLKEMGLEGRPKNLVDFYVLLNKADEEVRKLMHLPRIAQYAQVVEELNDLFTSNHLWGTAWSNLANHIQSRNMLLILDSLASNVFAQNPMFVVEQDSLEKINSDLNSLLNEICDSDLSKELKQLLIARVKDVLEAIRKYHVGGTEGLKQAAQSFVSDLVTTEHNLTEHDRKNPTYTRVTACFLHLLMWLTPSPWEIVGAVPDITNFWLPKYEELISERKQIEQIVREAPTIQEACEKSSKVFNKQSQKSLIGHKEPKALPASKEASKTNARGAD